jgi:hypothetical protein
MIAAVLVVVPLWSGNAMAASGLGAFLAPPASLPIADRTILPTPSHHPMPRHYKPVRHNTKQAQQYYQPPRQYYEWHVH